MRFSLICALVPLASPYFIAYCEIERLLGLPQELYVWFDLWLPVVMILMTSLITFALPWIVSLFGDKNNDHNE